MSKNYNVQILVDGKPVKEYTKDGKVFIESRKGTEYIVRVKNNTPKRAIAILSVDGINVITGKIATPEDTGYVVNAFTSYEVQGYRKDNDSGGRFQFTSKDTGYSKEIDGTGVNSGVIGVLFVQEKETPPKIVYRDIHHHHYEEKQPFVIGGPYNNPWDYGITWTSAGNTCGGKAGQAWGGLKSGNSMESGASGNVLRSVSLNNVATAYQCSVQAEEPAGSFDAATTWGQEFSESVIYTDFERSNVTETYNIYYTSKESLKAMGVIKENIPAVSFPQSFPGFAQPPKNWKS